MYLSYSEKCPSEHNAMCSPKHNPQKVSFQKFQSQTSSHSSPYPKCKHIMRRRCPYLRVRQNVAKLHQCATSLLDYYYWHYLLLTNDHETPNCKHPLFLYITLAKQATTTGLRLGLVSLYRKVFQSALWVNHPEFLCSLYTYVYSLPLRTPNVQL